MNVSLAVFLVFGLGVLVGWLGRPAGVRIRITEDNEDDGDDWLAAVWGEGYIQALDDLLTDRPDASPNPYRRSTRG